MSGNLFLNYPYLILKLDSYTYNIYFSTARQLLFYILYLRVYYLNSTLKKGVDGLAKNKRNKMKQSNGEWCLAGKTNRHHNKARVRGGSWNPMNIFKWDINKHRAFHFLFGNRTLEEAAEYLRHMNELKLLGIEPDPNWG